MLTLRLSTGRWSQTQNVRFLILCFLVQNLFGTVLKHFSQCNFKFFVVCQPWWPKFFSVPPDPKKCFLRPWGNSFDNEESLSYSVFKIDLKCNNYATSLKNVENLTQELKKTHWGMRPVWNSTMLCNYSNFCMLFTKYFGHFMTFKCWNHFAKLLYCWMRNIFTRAATKWCFLISLI